MGSNKKQVTKIRTSVSDMPLAHFIDFNKVAAEFEVNMICSHLKLFGGNIAAAARNFGLSRTTLYEKCRSLGINASRYRG